MLMSVNQERYTYRTVKDLVALVPPLLDMILECIRVKRFEELKAAKKFRRDRHDGSPIIEFAAVLLSLVSG